MNTKSTVRRRSLLLNIALIAVVAAPVLAQKTHTVVQSGHASGTFGANGKTYTLTYASAFVDAKDASKPVVLLLTDAPVPADVLSNAATVAFSQHSAAKSFSGVVLWLDKNRAIFRAEFYEKDDPNSTSSSGLFTVQFDNPSGNTLSGSAHSTSAAARMTHPVQLDVAFNAALK
jgi:hypothetical protein